VKLWSGLALLAAFWCASCSHGKGPPATYPLTATPTATAETGRISVQVGPGTAALTLVTQPIARTDDVRTFIWDSAAGKLYELQAHDAGVWSPDSSGLALRGCCVTFDYIEILDIRTGSSTRIQTGALNSLTWAPDSKRLAGTLTDGSIVVVDRNGSMMRFPMPGFAVFDYVWLSDSLLAGKGSTDKSMLLDLTTGKMTQLGPADVLTRRDPRVIFGTPDPTHTRVAFVDGEKVYVWDSRTGQARLVHDGGAGVAWSPDGRRLLLQYFAIGRPQPQTTVLDIETGAETALPEIGVAGQWLDDAEVVHLGFHCRTPDFAAEPHQVIATRADGAGSRKLTDTPDTYKYEGVLSPDRTYFAFSETVVTGERKLSLRVLRTSDASEAFSISFENDPHVHRGAWSPDGRYLRFWINGSHGICD
jgi:WD40 repeat protein